jgi:hypothetical protein
MHKLHNVSKNLAVKKDNLDLGSATFLLDALPGLEDLSFLAWQRGTKEPLQKHKV